MALLVRDAIPLPPADRRGWMTRIGNANLAIAAAGLLAAVLILLDTSGAPLAALKLAVCLALPGWVVVSRLQNVDPAARVVWTVAASSAAYVMLGVLMARTGLWYPRPVAVAVLLASSAALIFAPAIPKAVSAGSRSLGSVPWIQSGGRDGIFRAGKSSLIVAWSLLAMAVLLWIQGLATVRQGPLDDFGLLPQLPPVWYLAVALSVAVGIWGVAARSVFPNGLMSSALGLLVVILYATPGILAEAPRFPWTYKHIAVTNLITGTGQVDPSIDIYNRWPGFFSVSALLGETMGYRNALDYAAWAETGFALVDAVLVLAIARTLSNRARIYWTATLVFTLCNWVNQNYYSPQSLGYTLHLALCLLLLSFFRDNPGKWAAAFEDRIRNWRKGQNYRTLRPSNLDEKWERHRTVHQAPLIVACLLLQTAIVVSHQLTPYMAILGLFPLFLAGYFRPRWLGPALLAIPLLYFIPNLGYIKGKYGLFSGFDLFANTGYRPPSAQSILIGGWQLTGHTLANMAVILTLLVGVLALAGFARRLLQGHIRSTLVVAWLAFSPVLGLFVQSYGGEARFRIFLFALPWLAIGVAWLFWSGPIRSRRAVAGASAALAAMALMFTVVHYQPEAEYRVARDDVAASQWLNANVAAGDLVYRTKYFFPLLIDSNYPYYLKWGSVPSLTGYFEQSEQNISVKTLREYTAKLGKANDVYVVISENQQRQADQAGTREAYLLPKLGKVLAGGNGIEKVFSSETANIYRFPASG